MTSPAPIRQPTALSRSTAPAPPDPALAAILGPPPILASEDAAAYAALQDRVRATVEPADIIEELWVRDVTDLIWEALRLRRLKAKLVAGAKPQALSALLGGLMVNRRRDELVEGWARGAHRARKAVERELAKAGLDEAAIEAVTLSQRLGEFERIDRMIMQVEARRHAVLREVDRHRETLARQLRSVADDYAEAEPATIPWHE